jgi:hypothetical protein
MGKRRGVCRQSRAALAWSAAFFAAGQLLVAAWLSRCHPEMCDPDHNARLAALRARAAAGAGRPLVLVLGSSRAANGISPADLAGGGAGEDRAPVVFNFATLGAGPVRELLTLRRLLAEGYRPDWVLIEACPLFWPQAGIFNEDPGVLLTDVYPSDLPAIAELYPEKRWAAFARVCTRAAAPLFHYRVHFLDYAAPLLLPRAGAPDLVWGHAGWRGLDAWGWLADPTRPGAEEFRARLARQRKACQPLLDDFTIHPVSDRALRLLLGECRSRGIAAALVLLPEHSSLRGWYPPAALRQVRTYLEGLGQEYAVPVVNTREWVGDDAFVDFCHLHAGAARAFSARFGREVLRPLLQGRATVPDRPSLAEPGRPSPPG